MEAITVWGPTQQGEQFPRLPSEVLRAMYGNEALRMLAEAADGANLPNRARAEHLPLASKLPNPPRKSVRKKPFCGVASARCAHRLFVSRSPQTSKQTYEFCCVPVSDRLFSMLFPARLLRYKQRLEVDDWDPCTQPYGCSLGPPLSDTRAVSDG